MSFLDSVLSSIETGKPSPISTSSSALTPPLPSSNTKAEVRRPTLAARPVPPERKNNIPLGTKRKAEEPLMRPKKPEPQASTKSIPTRPAPSQIGAKPRTTTTSTASKPSTAASSATQKTPQVPSKAPIKGSYQDLMMKAKALQQNAPTQVGMFKHQSAPKEKLSKVERKRRALEAQTKEKATKGAKKAGTSSTVTSSIKPSNAKASGKREPEVSSYRGTGRPTPTPTQPEYRGTAGLPSRYGPGDRHSRLNKRSRMNEYLGTDEEDEGEFADEYDDYYSESSDMEAGVDDMEEEEAAALATARREDEDEWRAELAAKKQKEERRRKLSQLASRR